MAWGRRRSKVRKATLGRDLNYVHPIMGAFLLPEGTEVILSSRNKVIDKYVLNAYVVLQRMGANPTIIEYEERYYLVSSKHLSEGNGNERTTVSKFRRSR